LEIIIKQLIKKVEGVLLAPNKINTIPQQEAILKDLTTLGRSADKQAIKFLSQQLQKACHTWNFTEWELQILETIVAGLKSHTESEVAVKGLLASLLIRLPKELYQPITSALSIFRNEESFQLIVGALSILPLEEQSLVWRRQEGAALALGERGDARAIPFLLASSSASNNNNRVQAATNASLLKLNEAKSGLEREPSGSLASASAVSSPYFSEYCFKELIHANG
jgi:hypothetical protein